jgi:autotransporter translocation and assembly factor TamB
VSSPPRVAAEKKPPAYALDLNVHIPKNCWLRNEAANIELRGLLRVLQQGGQLSLLGELETIRGSYFFYGNNFRIQRGLVSFDELTDINPQLNVEAWTEVERERINLTIGGRLRSPTLSLTSSSGYGEGDIIALLTLHRSSAGLDTLGAEEVVRSQALGLFGSFLQEELSRKASSTLGVDKFRIEPGSVQGLGLKGAEITLGTYLSSKIYVEYSRRLSQESGEQVGVEYNLRQNLFLLGNRDKNGLYRLGLSLKWDY